MQWRCRFRMPLFLLSLFCFLVAISILSPATETSAIHKHLEAHFGLDQVQEISDVDGIYQFLRAFEEKNLEMMPTSPKFWCEKRYYQYLWDDHYQAGQRAINHPTSFRTCLKQHVVYMGKSWDNWRFSGVCFSTTCPNRVDDPPPPCYLLRPGTRPDLQQPQIHRPRFAECPGVDFQWWRRRDRRPSAVSRCLGMVNPKGLGVSFA